MPHSIIHFAFCTLLLLSSANLFAQGAPVAPAADPANQMGHGHLDTMIVKGLTQDDFKTFPTVEHEELIYEKGDKKILVEYDAYFDYSSIVRHVILCNIQVSFDKKFEKDGPTKEELTTTIVKHFTERVNKLLALKREPLVKALNKHRDEYNHYWALLNEAKKQHAALMDKLGGFSPQANEDLKSKLWTQNLELQGQIAGNETMVAGLQKEIDRLTKARNDRRENLENSIALENLNQNKKRIRARISNIEENPNLEIEEKVRDEDMAKLVKEKESVELQIAEVERKMLPRQPSELVEIQKKLAELRTKLTEARYAYKNPRHPKTLELEQQIIPLEKDADQLKSKLLSAAQIERSIEDVSTLPSLRAKLSETRIATDVLKVKSNLTSERLSMVTNALNNTLHLENKNNEIKQHERAIELINEKVFDARTKINELEAKAFELVPLK